MRSAGAAVALAVLTGAVSAEATERHFNTTYESGVLSPGHAELEPWTTWSYGRSSYYSRFDERLEFELGVVDRLQTSLYWNFTAAAHDQVDPVTGTRARVNEFEFEGISSEWKLKLMDPVADALGLALYVEGGFGPVAAELESKVIVDKRWGNVLVAANVVGDEEWEFAQPGSSEGELELEFDGGMGYFVTPLSLVGLEVRHTNTLEDGALRSSIVALGPTVAYGGEGWWVSASVMPQLVAFKGSSAGSRLNLDTEERVRTRVLFGFDL